MNPVALFKDFLRKKGLKCTGQRLEVARIIFETQDEHLSADEVLGRLRTRDIQASKATVYRTLTLLLESGLLESWDFGQGYRSYDPVVSRGPHDHLVCVHCKSVVEFALPELDMLVNTVADAHGFQPLSRSLHIFGRCPKCQGLLP